MECVAGGDLLSAIERRGAYEEAEARRIFAQIVEAVTQMHSVGVVHRDLKPENICFTHQDQSQIKLIDMGAAGFDSPAGLSELCGTPLYAAPEITPWYFADNPKAAAKCPRYGREVDYWSLGIALFVMLSGEAPFEQDQPVELLLAEVRRGKLDFSGPLWSKISSSAQDLIQGLLLTDPKARLQLPAIRSHPWLAGELSQLPTQLHRAPPSPPPAPPPLTDRELLVMLQLLPLSVSPGPATRCCGDLRLLLVGGAKGEPPPILTIRVDETRRVSIFPSKQEEPPVASFCCGREHIIQWLSGGGLVPPSLELPDDSRLASFLRNFNLSQQRFRAFCLEQGIRVAKGGRGGGKLNGDRSPQGTGRWPPRTGTKPQRKGGTHYDAMAHSNARGGEAKFRQSL
ncbi:MAG: hypothetical protein SGPRY_001708 [Prymnesium sp.]